jgi:uncharacterized protein YbjQ (UPF0145 family)
VDKTDDIDGDGDAPVEAQQAWQREQEQSLARIEAGGIPIAAERRLSELREHGGVYTSDLSVSDFALCHQLGLRPLSQVMGSSIYQVGYQGSNWPSMLGGTILTELRTLSDAWNEVRNRALRRLTEEALQVGANAVVGVELRTGQHDWAAGSIEYVVIGTAARRGETGQREAPVLTELSVSDYAKLVQAGIEPVGIVAWSAVFFAATSYNIMLGNALNPMQNQEMTDFTQAVYGARETVMHNLGVQAEALSASGIVGVRINHSVRRTTVGAGRTERGGVIVTFHAVGAAIRETAEAEQYPPETTFDLSS